MCIYIYKYTYIFLYIVTIALYQNYTISMKINRVRELAQLIERT